MIGVPMSALAVTSSPETAAHLRVLAARYRDLAVSTWDWQTLSILKEMVRDYEDEAGHIEDDAVREPELFDMAL
jgi:hypothetical protein